MKLAILILIIIVVLFGFRIFKNISQSSKKKKYSEEKVIDLEKDSKTNEYKPKE